MVYKPKLLPLSHTLLKTSLFILGFNIQLAERLHSQKVKWREGGRKTGRIILVVFNSVPYFLLHELPM